MNTSHSKSILCFGQKYRDFHLRRWGSSLPFLRTQDTRPVPPSMTAEISRCTYPQDTFKQHPQPFRSQMQSFGTVGQTLPGEKQPDERKREKK